jgi:cell division protein FtsW (lipid II flippase)
MLPPTILIGLFYYLTHDLGSLMILLVSVFSMLLFTEINKKKLLVISFSTAIILLLGA